MSSVHIDLTYGINLNIVYIFIMGVVFRLIVPKIIFFMKVMLEKTRVAVIRKYLYDVRVYCESKNIGYM